MKRTRIAIITSACVMLIVIAFEIVTHFSSANGYYNSVEQLREFEKLYDSSMIIYTQEMENRYVDFIIDKDENYCVIEIDKKHTLLGQKYVKGTWSSKSMQNAVIEDVNLYNQSGLLDFTYLPHFGRKSKVKLSYCFAPIGADIVQDNLKTIEFTYNSMEYLLCLKLEVE